mmetsp:Transcript_5555/g.13646  ORF Transcript_5555/g.13646 Transcript_5555/m.13646 type:complete len:116 (-) Transcript_5555:41-388(-)
MIPLPEFPDSWGAPPESADGWGGDIIVLAGGYGYGRKELSSWILQEMQQDKVSRHVQYPPAFGEQPRMMTRDYVPLPFGYGHGSGTTRTWLVLKAKQFYGVSPEQYEAAEAVHEI